jgi:hypothetical protein
MTMLNYQESSGIWLINTILQKKVLRMLLPLHWWKAKTQTLSMMRLAFTINQELKVRKSLIWTKIPLRIIPKLIITLVKGYYPQNLMLVRHLLLHSNNNITHIITTITRSKVVPRVICPKVPWRAALSRTDNYRSNCPRCNLKKWALLLVHDYNLCPCCSSKMVKFQRTRSHTSNNKSLKRLLIHQESLN